jgi:pimeloyl-ACP methyl ester carboxylesterase
MAKRFPRPIPTDEVVSEHVRTLPRRFRRDAANGLSAEWELRVGAQTFAISVADHACFVRKGPSASPATIITTEPATWIEMDEGTIAGAQAFMERQVGVSGNLDLAVRLQTLFKPYKRARRPADLDQVEIEVEGVKLSTYLVGEGPPIVLVHGLGGSKVTWLPVLPALAEKHRVIVPDLPGHGESDKPRTDYTPRFFARALRRLMDAVEVDRAVIVGNSLGGRIAIELALRSPGRVSSLALLDPSVPGLRWRYILGFTRVFPTEFGAIPFPLRERWMEVAIKRLFAHPDRMPREAYSAAAGEFIRIYRNANARIAFFDSLRRIVTERPEVFYASLRRIKQPTLVIFGEKDGLVPLRLGVRLAEHLPNAQLIVLPDVGHVPQFEATKETLEALLSFLGEAG